MKFQRMKKTLAVFLSVAVVGGAAAISAGAEEAAYTPNRSITISNEAAAASLTMTALPDHLGAGETVNGPYHLWAMMKIDGMTAIDNGAEASVALTAKYGYYTAGSDDLQYKTVELGKWTADTDGWVEMTTAAGPHFVLEAIDPSGEDDVYGDVTIEFAMNNAGGDFSFADLVIADKDNQIVYSLANDPCFSGITDFSRKMSSVSSFLWTPLVDRTKTSVTVATAGEKNYTPNRVLTMDIPENVEGETSAYPESFGYLHLDASLLKAEDGPFTLRGMVKVENFAANSSKLNADAETRGSNPAFLMGNPFNTFHGLIADTDWIPFLNGDGTPLTFVRNNDASQWYAQFFCSWGATGKYSLADLEVLDKDGNVVYSFADDKVLASYTQPFNPGVSPDTSNGKPGLFFWANDYVGVDTNTRIQYTYSVADQMTEHSAEDYQIPTFEETYVPYEETETSSTSDANGTESTTGEPSQSETPSTSDTNGTESTTGEQKTPDTGSSFPSAVLLLGTAAAAAVLFCRKKRI